MTDAWALVVLVHALLTTSDMIFATTENTKCSISKNYRKENTFGGKAGLSRSTSSDYKQRTL